MDKHYELIVKTFYDNLEQGKILGRKCTRCGHVAFPPYLACNECGYHETEWVETSGKGEVTCVVAQSVLHSDAAINEEFGSYAYCTVKTAEGDEVNTVLLGVKKKELPALRTRLPLPVTARIVQRDGYKAVFWELDK